jgi:hypothetical protein
MKPKTKLAKLEFLLETLNDVGLTHTEKCSKKRSFDCDCGNGERENHMMEILLEWIREEKRIIKERKIEKFKAKEKEVNIFQDSVIS